jgi:NAD(P)-dependent dehydrogenase (short-subunit alcohol dehydrogenase family)
LTELLLDLVKKSAPSRVVVVSSCYHDKAMGREGFIDIEDLHFNNREYDGWTSYAQSKLANVLHAKALAKRLEGTGVTAVSLHPGWVRTRLIRNLMPTWMSGRRASPFPQHGGHGRALGRRPNLDFRSRSRRRRAALRRLLQLS